MAPARGTSSAARLAAPCGSSRPIHHTPTPHIPHTQPPPDSYGGAVYEPEEIAVLDPAQTRALIAALSPAQRVTQATAYAAWLNAFGYGVSIAEALSAWGHDDADADSDG